MEIQVGDTGTAVSQHSNVFLTKRSNAMIFHVYGDTEEKKLKLGLISKVTLKPSGPTLSTIANQLEPLMSFHTPKDLKLVTRSSTYSPLIYCQPPVNWECHLDGADIGKHLRIWHTLN